MGYGDVVVRTQCHTGVVDVAAPRGEEIDSWAATTTKERHNSERTRGPFPVFSPVLAACSGPRLGFTEMTGRDETDERACDWRVAARPR